jgi:hypothetical protein
METRIELTRIVALLLLLILLPACGSGSTSTTPAEPIVLEKDDAGRHIKMVPGQELAIRLWGQLDILAWEIESDPEVLVKVGLPWPEKGKDYVDEESMLCLDFRAVSEGKTTLEVRWHKLGFPNEINTFTVDVTVR